MKAYYIVDWDELYEVNSSGRAWQPGQKKRVNPLQYVRSYVYGPAGDNMAFAEVAEFAESFGEYAWPCAWGLFEKAKEIAARQEPEVRGFLLGRGGSPISATALQRITGFTQEQIELGFKVLCDPRVHWVELREIPDGSLNSLNSASLSENTNTKEERKKDSYSKEQKQPGKRARESSDSDSASQLPASAEKDIALKVATILPAKLGHTHIGIPNRQINADTTCFHKIGAHIARGHMGDPSKAAQACYAAAEKIKRKKGKHIALFITWFEQQLKARGHDWHEIEI